MFVNIDNKEQLFNYCELLPVAAVIAESRSGVIEFFNYEAQKLWKYSADEVVGKHQTFLHPKSYKEKFHTIFQKHIAYVKREKNVEKLPAVIECSDKEEIPVDIYANLVCVGEREYVVGIFISIEKRVSAITKLQEKNHSLSYLLENINGVSWEYDARIDRFIYISKNIATLFGYKSSDFHHISQWFAIIHPEDKRRVFMQAKKTMLTKEDSSIEYRIRKKDGDYVWILDIIHMKKSKDGKTERVYGFIIDITAQKETLFALQKEKDFVKLIIDAVDDSIMVINKDYKIRMMNAKAKEIFNIKEDVSIKELYCTNTIAKASGCTPSSKSCPLKEVIQKKKNKRVMHYHTDKEGEEHHIEVTAIPVVEADGEVESIIEIGHDITQHLRLIEHLKKSAELLDFKVHHDELTKLPNRLLLHDRMDVALSKAKRHQHKFAVLFLDLDHFKEVNDSMGHAAGDEVLLEAARRLLDVVREEDTLARLGGDEFVVLCDDICDVYEASRLAQRILERLQKPFVVKEKVLYIGCSIGIALYPDDGKSNEELLKNADAAMYKAKESGRNRYEYYTKNLTTIVNNRIELERELRRALREGEFVLHYQPQIDVKSKSVVGAEVLIRWEHPTKGLLYPESFLAYAMESGLIVEIDRWVLQQALKDASHWRDMGVYKGDISLNLAAKQLEDESFIPFLKEQLQNSSLRAKNLKLEILEHEMMQDMQNSLTKLETLKTMGITIALDDFGTGYSSLTYLHKFPIDEIKLDRAFVRSSLDENSPEIALAIIAMAKAMDLRVIAEGIESNSDLAFMLQHECFVIQGYYYSKPVDARSFEAYVKKESI